MSFDWQTEEELNWEEEVITPEPNTLERRRWLWAVLIGVLLVSTAVFILIRQLNQSVETATDGVEANLIASYAVLQQAAQTKDENLFSSLLSGREPDWSLSQQTNLRSGLLFDRPGFDLEWQPGLAETAVFSQTLSPDLTAAELTTLQSYRLDIGQGLSQTVQLERVDVYRLGEDRWLLAPPEADFWGIRRRLAGQLLSVRYPARDEAIVQRLAADLEAKLVQLCNLPGIECPSDIHVRLEFSPDPEALIHTTFIHSLTHYRDAPRGAILGGEQRVSLPTPSLVGVPQDELGYQILLRGYASQFLLPIMNDVVGWECCRNVPYYRAVVTYQLYEMGVGSWPLAMESLPNDFTLGNGALYWNAPFPEISTDFAETPAPYAVIGFLINERHLTAAEITTSVLASEGTLFGQWLTELTGPPWTEATLNHAFQEYIAGWQAEPGELAQPNSDLVLLCQDTVRQELGLYQYDFSQEMPQLLENLLSNNIFFTALPDGSGLAVSGLTSDREPETYLLRNGETRIEVNWNNVEGLLSSPPLAIPTTTDPNGRYLLWTITQGYSTGNFYALTDLTTCHEGDSCEAISIGGYPIWSPTSEQLITLTVTNPWWSEGLSNGLMLLRDAPTAEAINSPGFGFSVAWRNAEQFGYLNQLQNGRQQLVLADGSLDRPEVVMDNATLLSLFKRMSAPGSPSSLRIQFAQPLPTDPNVYAILADDWLSGDTTDYLLLYNYADENISLVIPLPPVDFTEAGGVRWSPDGRTLLISLTDAEDMSTLLAMLELDAITPQLAIRRLEGETIYPRHFYASWSPDREWLAMPELGYIRLWRNGSDERLLNFDDLDCTNAAWVARMER
jgi:hypothetical protein